MERGATLSTGQAQRISYIRALVYNPQILVLDVATASVDTETEELIRHAINKLMEGRTTIAIAHRLATLRNANRLVVVEDGKSEDLFAHFSAIQMDGYKTLKAGQAVHFDVIQGPKGQHAVNIRTQEAAQALLPDSTLATTVSA